ncbi:putative transposase [Aurantimonas sp. 22II-16-19i]|nr:putative transposase [Aurantimonas sp. 22II-16-19i]
MFRRLFLEGLADLHARGKLVFCGALAHLADGKAFARHLTPVRRKRWVVYAKPPFAGPKAVLAFLSRYTHRVAISSWRITAFDGANVTFRVKDYRQDGTARHRTLTLEAGEFIRRFLLHILPKGFHRIRHYGLLAGADREAKLDHVRDRIARQQPSPAASSTPASEEPTEPHEREPSQAFVFQPCPCCGAPCGASPSCRASPEPGRHPLPARPPGGRRHDQKPRAHFDLPHRAASAAGATRAHQGCDSHTGGKIRNPTSRGASKAREQGPMRPAIAATSSGIREFEIVKPTRSRSRSLKSP